MDLLITRLSETNESVPSGSVPKALRPQEEEAGEPGWAEPGGSGTAEGGGGVLTSNLGARTSNF